MKQNAGKRQTEKLPGIDAKLIKLRLTKMWSAYIRTDPPRKQRIVEGAKPKWLTRD